MVQTDVMTLTGSAKGRFGQATGSSSLKTGSPREEVTVYQAGRDACPEALDACPEALGACPEALGACLEGRGVCLVGRGVHLHLLFLPYNSH